MKNIKQTIERLYYCIYYIDIYQNSFFMNTRKSIDLIGLYYNR